MSLQSMRMHNQSASGSGLIGKCLHSMHRKGCLAAASALCSSFRVDLKIPAFGRPGMIPELCRPDLQDVIQF